VTNYGIGQQEILRGLMKPVVGLSPFLAVLLTHFGQLISYAVHKPSDLVVRENAFIEVHLPTV